MSKRLMAREIREMLRGKVDPKLLFTLEALAEQQSVLRQNLMTLAETVNKVIDNLAALQHVAEHIKDNAVMRMKQIEGDDDDLPPVTN